MKKKLLLAVSIMVVLASALSLLPVQPSGASHNEPKVTICHRTDSASNPYTTNSVSVSSVDGGIGNGDHFNEHKGPLASSQSVAQALKNDHDEWGDIIPPVPGFHSGLNWTALGQAMYNNDCNFVTQVTPTNVTFVNPTCSTTGSYTIPSKTGVVYKIGSTTKAAGTYSAATGTTITVTAYASNSGYFLNGTTTWTHTFVLTETCTTQVTPSTVTFVDPTCDEDGSYTIPSKTGVVYKIGGNVVGAGVYPAINGQTVTVTAHAASNAYVLTGTTSWSHTFAIEEDCVTEVEVEAVTFVDPFCETDGSYTIPESSNVVYKIGENVIPAGTYEAEDGDIITVTAYPVSDEFELVGQTTWTHTFVLNEECEEEQYANIKYGVECSTEGAVVTLVNSGNASGEVTLNGETITIEPGATVERTFDTTDAGLQITIVINEKTVYDELVICDTGEVLGETTPPVLPNTSGSMTIGVAAFLGAAAATIGLISIAARTTLLSRR